MLRHIKKYKIIILPVVVQILNHKRGRAGAEIWPWQEKEGADGRGPGDARTLGPLSNSAL